MRILFLPEIEQDVVNAYRWYESKSGGLGEEFLRVFYAQTAEICRMPRRYPIVFKDFRRALLRRFPYAVYFLINGSSIHVYGVFHCARNPLDLTGSILRRESGKEDAASD